ncbi:sarcosine oxidase subunit gamma [Agriterribacter humi]|uniref:sarcosine oxidase subunit gamma n=1 Tax=Agriterribacter humi TaxID=1104781 RepID=UPI00186B2ED9|nr:sarcosine oxidase subunit gamma family protein [Agriterribacter humi]
MKNQHHFSAVDVSGQRTTIELEGAHARDVLAHLWEQDLREKSFPVGSVSQGLIAKAPVIVCHVAPLRYRIMVRSSFAVHVWKALVDAGEEWV